MWSSSRPQLRKKLLNKYRLDLVYNGVLFLIVFVPGWSDLASPGWITLLIFGTLLLGDLSMQRESGWWKGEKK